LTFFRGYGTAIVNLCISALDVFLCDDEWHEPVASEVGGIGARARQFEFSTLAVIADAAGAPFTANKMKFAAPTAHDSKLYWHALIMLRRMGLDSGTWQRIAITLPKEATLGRCSPRFPSI